MASRATSTSNQSAAGRSSTKAPTESKENNFIDTEYKELNNHIRECWKYISDLLRSFLFLQIILLSVIFLGGGVVKVEGVTVTTGQQVVATPAPGSANTETAERFRKTTVIPLLIFGVVGSVGAIIQNLRLFKNATAFVERAAFLESTGGFVIDSSHGSLRTSPPTTYMRDEMYGNRSLIKLDLRWLLTLVYGLCGCIWAWYSWSLFTINFSF